MNPIFPSIFFLFIFSSSFEVMDTEYDFLKPEFLHLIFFKQKNVVIFPHVDLKHLRALEAFTVGYNLIDLEATALYNIREMIKSNTESYSQTPNYHLVYNLDKKRARKLLELENAHAILNVNQNCSDLIETSQEDFIFYNKKSKKFLNYNFTDEDLKMEIMILNLAKTYDMIRDELQEIKNIASKLYTRLMDSPDAFDLDKIINNYTLEEKDKILEFTENYYDIILPKNDDEKDDSTLQTESNETKNWDSSLADDLPKFTTTRTFDFSDEFAIIKDQNRDIFQIFINQLDEYRQQNVNSSNLELKDFFMPNDLYNYLRRHHWSDQIPKEFLIQWKNALNKNGGLSKDEVLDFEVILRGLGVKNSMIEKVISMDPFKQECSIINNDDNTQSNYIEIKNNLNHNQIPPVSDFPNFKTWVIKKLDLIEKKIKER